MGAHNHHFGQFGAKKLTPALVEEYRKWEMAHGLPQ
jgi:hypothetical protein